MGLREVAKELNKRLSGYEIAGLPAFRKRVTGKSRTKYKLFSKKTIHDKQGESIYAYHDGGRTELQFNIGVETDDDRVPFRYGVAFSLEQDQALTKPVERLAPKIKKFNEFVRLHPGYFNGYEMWCFPSAKRSRIISASEIPEDWSEKENFIFIGKRFKKFPEPLDNKKYNEILETFDWLFDVYKYVESDMHTCLEESAVKKQPPRSLDFPFRSGYSDRKEIAWTSFTNEERRDVLHHNIMLMAVCRQLDEEIGDERFGAERNAGVDIVIKDKEGLVFFELKTDLNFRRCIRLALSQIMEYAFYPDESRAYKLVIVGPCKIDKDGEKYMKRLRNKHKINVYFRHFNPDSKRLESKEY